MAFEGLVDNTRIWEAVFERSAELRPSIFAKLILSQVALPLRQHNGAIVMDEQGRYWLCEPTLIQTQFVSLSRFQGVILSPIYGPWEGRRPDMIALNEFERTMIDALEYTKNKRRTAA